MEAPFDGLLASLIVGRKFIVFALFYFVFEGNFPSTSPQGAYIWWGDLTVGFLRLTRVWGAYIWRVLFSEFYGISVFDSLSFELKSFLGIAREWSREKFANFVHRASESCKKEEIRCETKKLRDWKQRKSTGSSVHRNKPEIFHEWKQIATLFPLRHSVCRGLPN